MNTPWTVDVLPPLEGRDEYGNDLTGHDVDNPDTQKVYGWAPAGTDETATWRRTVTADLQLFAPPGFRCTSQDAVVVDGVTYTVEGVPEDYTHGPFGWEPGIRVNLTRVEG